VKLDYLEEEKKEQRITSIDGMKSLLTANVVSRPAPSKQVPCDFELNLPKTGVKDLDDHYEKECKYKWSAPSFDAPASPITHINLGNGNYYYGETKDGKPHGRGAKVILSDDTPYIEEAWYNYGEATG